MPRTLSYSELSTLLECEARHAFRYTGQLTNGHALRPKVVTPRMQAGKAWGVAVALWHETGELAVAEAALEEELAAQLRHLEGLGALIPDEFVERAKTLRAALDDYLAHTARLPGFQGRETELDVWCPAITQADGESNRYRFQAFVDGLCRDQHNRTWIVEFKWRSTLGELEWASRSPQLAWSVWAARKQGLDVVGVILDERLADFPRPVQRNKDGTPSARQRCRPEQYEEACCEAGVEPNPRTLDQLRRIQWHRRTAVRFTERDLRFAEQALAALAARVGQLDRGQLVPVRHASPFTCRTCLYRDVCADPDDTELVDALFERRPPKREVANGSRVR